MVEKERKSLHRIRRRLRGFLRERSQFKCYNWILIMIKWSSDIIKEESKIKLRILINFCFHFFPCKLFLLLNCRLSHLTVTHCSFHLSFFVSICVCVPLQFSFYFFLTSTASFISMKVEMNMEMKNIFSTLLVSQFEDKKVWIENSFFYEVNGSQQSCVHSISWKEQRNNFSCKVWFLSDFFYLFDL